MYLLLNIFDNDILFPSANTTKDQINKKKKTNHTNVPISLVQWLFSLTLSIVLSFAAVVMLAADERRRLHRR